MTKKKYYTDDDPFLVELRKDKKEKLLGYTPLEMWSAKKYNIEDPIVAGYITKLFIMLWFMLFVILIIGWRLENSFNKNLAEALAQWLELQRTAPINLM
jgi:hypothetical protein